MSVQEEVTKQLDADLGEHGSVANAKRRILMPVDSSENSLRAFNWYVDQMHRESDGLLLVHVVEPSTAEVNLSAASKTPALSEQFSLHITQLIETGRVLGKKYIDLCKEKNVQVKFTLHIGTKPGQQIVRLSEEMHADVIVVGNRGIGTIRRTFLGSVSDHILHHASIPVAVVPPPAKKK